MSAKPATFSTSTQPCDVEVTLGKEVLHLHSSVLRHCSPVFEAGMSEQWWNDPAVISDGDIRYKYRLVEEADGEWNLIPTHQILSKTVTDTPPLELSATYTQLFKAMYHRLEKEPPSFKSCNDLVDLADMYDAIACVRLLVTNYFLQQDNTTPFVLLSIKLKSKTMYSKCFRNIVDDLLSGVRARNFDSVPDFTMARAHKVAYEDLRPDAVPVSSRHKLQSRLLVNELGNLLSKYSEEYPWEKK